MAVTEQPVDIVSSRGPYLDIVGSFVLGDHTKRVNWVNSFYVNTNANVEYLFNNAQNLPGPPFIGYGGLSGVAAPDQITFNLTGPVTTTVPLILQLYILSTGAGQIVQAASTTASFPVGSIPIAFAVLDAVGRIQSVVDARSSYLSSAPSFGAGTENISAPTLRASYAANYSVPRTYALSAKVPPDLALPATTFTLGAGSVIIAAQTISTPATVLTSTTKVNNQNPTYAFFGALVPGINQGYIDPTSGALTVRQVQVSGVFPANSLALFECTVDSASLIRNLADFRPSYI